MDVEKFLAERVAKSTQQQKFYHFTDRKNLDSIRKHGLLCTHELRSRKLFDTVTTGGDELSLASDLEKGTDKFVCLCFTLDHPMSYVAQQRGLDPIYLHIAPQVLLLPGVMITNAASNQSGVERIPAAKALDDLDLDVLYTRMDWRDQAIHGRLSAARKYEILVPSSVATKHIVYGLG